MALFCPGHTHRLEKLLLPIAIIMPCFSHMPCSKIYVKANRVRDTPSVCHSVDVIVIDVLQLEEGFGS